MKKIILTALVFSTLLFSCSDYLDSPNEDFTNNPNNGLLNPIQKLAGAQLNLLNNENFSYNLYGNRMTYAYGLNSGFTSNDAAYNFNFTSGTYSGGAWSTHALYVDNLQDIIDSESKFPGYQNHYAIAKILKVQGMEKIIALFGDAPYSEAFRSKEGLTTPKFDDDKQIYIDILELLDEAREDILNADPSVDVTPGAEDIVFGGNMSKWSEYANTIELRILLRLSKTTDAEIVALRAARFTALNGLPFVTTDVTYNPGFTGATAAQSNPMFRQYGTTVAIDAFLQGNRANAAGDYIAQVINGQLNTPTLNTVGVTDPRRARMFNLVSGNVLGAIQGTETTTTRSRLAGYVSGFTGLSNPDAYNNGTTRDAYAMLAAESYFLQAEAIQRGFLSGNAQTMFNQGITESFRFYSQGFGSIAGLLSVLDSNTYIAAIDGKNGLGWTGSTDKISCIMTQKWLALSQWTGIEPYFDFLRTGYPAVPLPQGVSQTTRPNRLIYDSSSYSANPNNTPSVTLNEIFTINSKTPFYLQ